ncbi:MAG: hypothetical protein L3K08_08525 [Thermoplasmata archaeon]|nr:hypothetical protein [Thermoplasmata archaeon]
MLDTLVYDSSDGYTLMFGGQQTFSGSSAGASFTTNATWGYWAATDTWENLTTAVAPPAADQWALADDRSDSAVIAFGGGTSETWSFHAGTWQELAPTHHPPVLSDPCMTYDSTDGYVLLFGGFAANESNQTWSYVGGDWTNRTSGISPPAASYCGLVDDPALSAVIEYGGLAATLTNSTYTWTSFGETWTYAAGIWTEQFPAASPGPRGGAMLMFDTAESAVVLFGGTAGDAQTGFTDSYDSDTWSFHDGNWFDISTSRTPPARAYGGLAFDAGVGAAVLYGGWAWPNVPVSTWRFQDPIQVGLSTPGSSGGDVGQPEQLAVNVTGASFPVTYQWTTVPDGCRPQNAPSVPCLYSTEGTQPVVVRLVDAANVTASFATNISISPTFAVTLNSSTTRTDAGYPVQLAASSTGGSGPVSFGWLDDVSELNCLPEGNGPFLNCTAAARRTFPLTATGFDANLNFVTSNTVYLNVAPEFSAGLYFSTISSSVGQPVRVTTSPEGGTPPYSYHYVGLPRGCTEANLSTLLCTPTATGSFLVTSWVNDSVGGSVEQSALLMVGPAPPVSPPWEVPALLVGAATAVGITAVVWRRRRSRPSQRF